MAWPPPAMQGNLMGADWKPPTPMGGSLQDLIQRLRGGGAQVVPYTPAEPPVGMSLVPTAGQGGLPAGPGQLALNAGRQAIPMPAGSSLSSAYEAQAGLGAEAAAPLSDISAARAAGGANTFAGGMGAGATEAELAGLRLAPGGGGAGGLLSRLSGAAGLEGAGPLGGAKILAGRAPMALGAYLAGQAAGGLNTTFGGFEGPHQTDITAELQGAGTGAGIGTMIAPGPGTLIGGLLGAAGGGAMNVGKDWVAVNKYDKLVDQFINVNKHMPASMRKEAKQAALQIHNADIPLTQKPAALSALIDQMRQAKQQRHAQGGLIETDRKRQLAIQAKMAATMDRLGQGMVDRGDAYAATVGSLIPNLPPEAQALAQLDATQRAQFGRDTRDQYTAATYMQPEVDRMNAQLAQLAQLQQQLSAQSGGQSISALLAGGKNK